MALASKFITIANYINCNIFVKIWYVFSVITRLLATKLYQGLIFNGIWHAKLKFTFSKVVTQHPSKGTAAKIVQYYKQKNSINYISCTKWFLAVMTPRYIAFNLTKNWFGQTWAGMRNWYYMGRWIWKGGLHACPTLMWNIPMLLNRTYGSFVILYLLLKPGKIPFLLLLVLQTIQK